MDRFVFVKHAKDIWDVAKARDVDVGVAYDMFRADVENGYGHESNTAGFLPEVNFAELKVEWDKLGFNAQMAAYEAWHEFFKHEYHHYCDAVIAGTGDEFMAAYIADQKAQ